MSRLRVILNPITRGRWVARALVAPWIVGSGDDRDAAKADLVERLAEVAAEREWDPSAYPFLEHQELMFVDVDVVFTKPPGQDPLPLTVTTVVSTLDVHGKPLYSVTAPSVDKFRMLIADREQLHQRTRAALAHRLRKWSIPRLLLLDDGRTAELDEVEVRSPVDPDGDEVFNAADDTDLETAAVYTDCGVNVCQSVSKQRHVRFDRRDSVVERFLDALGGDGATSVVLVGPGDVGKTALIEELAVRIVTDRAPEPLRRRNVWEFTADRLIADQKYLGMWQGRMTRLVAEAARYRDILCMGDPQAIIDAGQTSANSNNMARFLKPFVERGEITVICETTPDGYAAATLAEPGFMNALRRVDVPATEPAVTGQILLDHAGRLEHLRGVTIAASARATAQELTGRFLPYRAMPGKAIRLLNDVAARADGGVIDGDTVMDAFTRATGLPKAMLSDAEPLIPHEVAAWFSERILGQDAAVAALVDLVLVIKAGLNDPAKPLGSLFFVGPTGVGKTESAKVLAEFLFGARERMLRFDMAEYAGVDGLARLVGSAWRSDQQGELTRRVREQPFSVVLLDEIEKAHPDVFDALLSALGEGRITDPEGRTTDLRNTIIVMTSNLGAPSAGTTTGFGATGDGPTTAHFIREAERFFSPEFYNRIDRVVAFPALDPDTAHRITRREVGRVLMREGIVRRNLIVDVDEPVVDRLVARGFHPIYGARPLQREIQRTLVAPIARRLVETGPSGGTLRVSLGVDGELVLEVVAGERPAGGEARRPDLRGGVGALRKRLKLIRAQIELERAEEAALHARSRELQQAMMRPTFWDDAEAARAELTHAYDTAHAVASLELVVQRADEVHRTLQSITGRIDAATAQDLAATLDEIAAELERARGVRTGGASSDRV